MKKFLFAAAIFVSSLLCSCNYGCPPFLFGEEDVESRATCAPVLFGNNLPQVGTESKYSFIVFTDSHFGNSHKERREESFLLIFKSLLQSKDPAMRPRFIVNIGDTLDGGHSSEADFFNATAARWIETAKEILGVSDYKVYSILGNHDLYNNGWEVWRTRIYPYTSFYTFTLNAGGPNNFDFWFLDTGNGSLGAEQIEFLEGALAASARPKIVFMHYPLYAGGIFYFALDDVTERARLISDFARSNVKYVFEGHKHEPLDYDFGNFKEAVIGAYLEDKVFGLVTVDEATGLINFARINY